MNTLLFYFAAILLVAVLRKTDAQTPRPPLCHSQFSLANYACSNLPFIELPHDPPSTTTTPPSSPATSLVDLAANHGRSNRHGRNRRDEDGNERQGGHHRGHGHHGEGHGHHGDGHGHHGEGHGHHRHGLGDSQEHGHGGGHHHHHHDSATTAEENCCMWLTRMDSECVCDVLVRLPPFLAKPSHKYTVYVNDACVVTFSCSGRIVP
ncbi:hypothetical protein LINGRAHAP2_LOCUS17643 [Linum grandiflorum]